MELRSPRVHPRCVSIPFVIGSLVLGAAALIALAARASPETPLELPADRIYDEQGSPASVIFSHLSHAAYADNRCLACHPQPFSILGRHRGVTHEEMEAGRACGICHNGREATGVDDGDACDTCHTGVAPEPSGPRPVRLARGTDSIGPVIFAHATHAVACRTCHPQPFAMRVSETPLAKDAMLEGGGCGRCHDGISAFGVDDGKHCETCHRVGDES